MTTKTTLNAKNLEALGAERLAELLIEISMGSAANKRRLRIELAGAQSSGDVAREVAKRLSSIERSRSKITWRRVKTLKQDLETQRQVIIGVLANADPDEALEMAWRFMGLARSIFDRCEDTNGTIMTVFEAALDDLGAIALMAKPEWGPLAERVFSAITDDEFGQYDRVLEILAPAMGPDGLAHLRLLLVDWLENSATGENDFVGRRALRSIADQQGDVDAYAAQRSEAEKSSPAVAAQIAGRLLGAGRLPEALEVLEKATARGADVTEWQLAWTDVLDGLGRGNEAQEFRWACFERTLSIVHLRAFLKRLPDFDDIEAEDRAIAYAAIHSDMHQALKFLLDWTALDKAAGLVLARSSELDGDHYELLTPAAELLAGKYPLAAVLLLRAMIDFALDKTRPSRYRHAARHLRECEGLGERVPDFGAHANSAAYRMRLGARHGKKTAFWKLV